ncbi:hypothetical protein SMSP2_01751 [Limihaloglobus sulfuriphilus]|uniref:Beta-xylosidase n=1 Tax=Limihaloglobus sulfuriphilus TaxID=1851148 RepID=A0A1Q2MFP8_9BACT|nr:hypothetical protein [Limihaloglobus sulfuriphilus]AQQ71378.1 hypothetical protein SMSP2_01751 [Limihaloglobus sulfuriphilus]
MGKCAKYALKAAVIAICVVSTAAAMSSRPQRPFTEFKKNPDDRPVISSGSNGRPTFMSDPVVIKDKEGYHAFFSNFYIKKNGQYWISFDPQNQDAYKMDDFVGSIAYAFSSDQGLSWTLRQTPCLMPGPQAWCDDVLETPSVIKDGDRLVMFYSALGSRNGRKFLSRYQIGGATLKLNGKTIREKLLDESIQFTKIKQPVVPHNTSIIHHDNNTQEPSVVLKDGRFELFYIGLTLQKPDEQIPGVPGQGIKKVALYKAVFDKDLNLILAADDALINGANITEVHYHDGAYHVFSTQSPSWFSNYPGKAEGLDKFHYDESITYYHSAEGQSWSKPQTILEKGTENSFDSWGIMAPTVVFENDRLVMFYTAWQLGNQTMTPLPADGRYGLRRGQEQTIWGTMGRAEATYNPRAWEN